MKITNKTATIITGVAIELTNDDATHLSRALKGYQEARAQKPNRLPWPWLDKLIEDLDEVRGNGCIAGRHK